MEEASSELLVFSGGPRYAEMSPITRFDAGPSPLARISHMKGFVVDYYDAGGGGEGALVELVQTYPILMIQLGVLFLCVLNMALQGMVSSKFGAAMRKQSVVLAMCSAALDIFAHLNVIAGAGDTKGSASSSGNSNENPFASLMKGMVPNLPTGPGMKKAMDEGKEDKGNEKEEDGGKPEEVDLVYLTRARKDMGNLSKGRTGQILAFAIISFLCGSKKMCMLPLLLRNLPFMIRGALLVLALLAPDLALPMVLYSKTKESEGNDEGASKKAKKDRKKGSKKKSYRQESRGKIEMAGVDVSTLLFPVDLCAPGGDMLQDLCDLVAWPLEQMILSGWMKQLTSGIFGSGSGGSKKLFGIPVGAKDSKGAKTAAKGGGPPKMGKYKDSPGTVAGAGSGASAEAPKQPVNMLQIGSFASRALCIYNYQRIRSRGISKLESLPRLVKMLNIPGGEALLASMNKGAAGEPAAASEAGGDGDGSDGPDSPPDNDDDTGGDGGRGVVVLPSAKLKTMSDTPVPVTATVQVAREEPREPTPSLSSSNPGRPAGPERKRKKKKRRPTPVAKAGAD